MKTYDMAGDLLEHLLTNLEKNPIKNLAPYDNDWASKGVLKKFFQSEFLDTTIFQIDGLDDFGYIYYPYRCIDGSVESCKVHMHLHGCT